MTADVLRSPGAKHGRVARWSALRMPAYGREVALALRAGKRPVGGTIVISTEWDYATRFVRLVCDPGFPAESFDFSFLRAQQVVILVPKQHADYGRELLTRLRKFVPLRAVVCIVREGEL